MFRKSIRFIYIFLYSKNLSWMWILQSWIFPTESLEGTFHIFQRIQCEELQTQLKPWGPELLNQLFFCRVWLQAQFSSQKEILIDD